MRHSTAGKNADKRQALAERAVLATKHPNGHVRSGSNPIMSNISWDAHKLALFKAALADAEVNMDKCFEFEGHAFLVTYAHYLVEYLKGKV